MKTLVGRLLVLVVGAFALPTYAATFAVNSSNDVVDALPGDGLCATRSGVCTVRAAVQEANALAGKDSITLPAGSFLLTIGGRGEEAAATGDLDITDDLVINGAGEGSSVISGYSSDRVFDVKSLATLTLSDLTIADGLAAAEEAGGGILNSGTAILTHVTLAGNRAGRGIDGGKAGGDGGGIENLGTATLMHVTLSRNHAGNAGPGDSAGWGGGLRNLGTATLIDVTFSGNQAGAGDPIPFTFHDGGAGGGMVNDGVATLVDVTFTANRAGSAGFDGLGGCGGGMLNAGTATLHNVSFAGNFAGDGGSNEEEDGGDGGHGGGLENYIGTATLTDVSFSQNRAGDGGLGGPGSDGGAGGNGGGMNNQGSATLNNVTFDRNRAGDGNGNLGGNGGGFLNDSEATLTNVTVSSNQAGNGNGKYASGGDGGGIENLGSVALTNVTIARNSAGNGAFGGSAGVGDELASDGSANLINTVVSGLGQNCTGSNIVSLGHNLDSGTTCGFAAAGDRSSTDPLLGPLKSNGGPTQTLALLPESPAIDAGDDTSCPVTDQRAVARPQGAACDIGAYEFQPSSPIATHTATSLSTIALTPTNTPTVTSTPTASNTSTSTTPATLTATPTDRATASATTTPEATSTVVAPFTPTHSVTSTPPNAVPTPTPTRQPCVGDCDENGKVTIDEILGMVTMAFQSGPVVDCPADDANGDGTITIPEILTAVNNALTECGSSWPDVSFGPIGQCPPA